MVLKMNDSATEDFKVWYKRKFPEKFESFPKQKSRPKPILKKKIRETPKELLPTSSHPHGRRRSMEGSAPVSRGHIEYLVRKIDDMKYGFPFAYRDCTPEEQKERNKALISLLYLSARRISEIVGRTYKGYTYEGVLVKDFREEEYEGEEVLIMNCEILKKWRQIEVGGNERKPLEKRYDVVMLMDEKPFIPHILNWLDHQKRYGEETRYMPISSTRAYQILQQLDPHIVGNHWFRHMRLTHLAESLNPYQLTQKIGFWEGIEPSMAYIHGRAKDYYEACRKARSV